MKPLDLDPQIAEDGLVLIATHVPPGVEIGRPYLAAPTDDGGVVVATEKGWWWPTENEVSRIVELGEDRAELTCWTRGTETFRRVAKGEYDAE